MKKGRGFTLIEVTIATIIIGIGILPVLSMFMTGTKFVEKGELYLMASIAAQNLLDLARSDEFIWEKIPNKVSVPGSGAYAQFKLPEGFVKKYGAKALISVEQAAGHSVVGTGVNETNLLHISVEVNWKEKEQEKKLRLETYKAILNSVTVKTSTKM